MTVGADKAQVLFCVIVGISVDVVHFKGDRFFEPVCPAATFAAVWSCAQEIPFTGLVSGDLIPGPKSQMLSLFDADITVGIEMTYTVSSRGLSTPFTGRGSSPGSRSVPISLAAQERVQYLNFRFL